MFSTSSRRGITNLEYVMIASLFGFSILVFGNIMSHGMSEVAEAFIDALALNSMEGN